MNPSTPRAIRYYVTSGDREHVVHITPRGDWLQVELNEKTYRVHLTETEDGELLNALVGSQSVTYSARFEHGDAVLGFHDREVRLQVENEREHLTRQMTGRGASAHGPTEVKSVMPGVVKELRVAIGAAVERGQPLLILEAMKMENEIRAPSAGIVAAVHVVEGASVEKGAALVRIEPQQSGSRPSPSS